MAAIRIVDIKDHWGEAKEYMRDEASAPLGLEELGMLDSHLRRLERRRHHNLTA
jgi:hypothetical protein